MAGLLGLAGMLHRRLTQTLVVGGIKDLAQNGRPVGGRRIQQPGKIVLGQHGYLGKLFGVDAQQLDHRRRDRHRPGDRFFRFPDQFRPGAGFTMPLPRLAARCCSGQRRTR